ncbi:hypothetical protein Q3G72_011854 [Acer saccharum]|nr:hypothetical protein Q3G72_011854 [Acer saccharum]
MQLFPERIINLWNKYEVRVIVLLSLVLQIILIILGNRRKLTASFWIRIIVWLAYLSADWVATVALGNLASSIGDSEDSTHVPSNALQEFWAPFLLLHLGGPDTITAYSLEDNELWLRHFLVLIIQVGVAFYVFLRSWGSTALTFLTIPIFISGVIKYGERTYALMSSSSEHFKDSLQSSPDSCQDFVKHTREKIVEESGELEEEMVIPQEGIHTEDHYLVLAFYLFTRTKFFFAKRTLNKDEQKRIYSIIKTQPTAEAFKLVAVELGFMYDMLYTKAAIVYSHLGIVFRCITFLSSVCALVVFSAIIDTHVYPLVDISITYLLLVGAVLLELYALILLFLSDWGKLWLIKLKKAQHNPISKSLADLFWKFSSHSQSLLTGNKRWSKSMGQYSLLSSCLKDMQPACFGVQKFPFIRKWLKNISLTRLDVNVDHIQETILEYLKEQGNTVNEDDVSYRECDLLLSQRGHRVIMERYNFRTMEAALFTYALEFVDSVIIWHIATDICYYGDLDDKYGGEVTKLDPKCKIGKCLSDYMCYLLVFRPSMLPKGIGEVRYKEACAEVTKLLKQKRDDHDIYIFSESKANEALLQKYEEVLKPLVEMLEDGDENDELFNITGSSLLMHGCLLYMVLQQKIEDDYEKKWEIISDFWVEMLAYAAHTCEWKEHARQLKKGGELLTHVCLLAAHFGLSKQYFHDTIFS